LKSVTFSGCVSVKDVALDYRNLNELAHISMRMYIVCSFAIRPGIFDTTSQLVTSGPWASNLLGALRDKQTNVNN